MRKTLVLAVLAGLLLVPVANATTITQVKTFNGIPNLIAPLTFNKFNPALGTLTSIEIIMEVYARGGTFSLDNDSTIAAVGNFSFGSQATILSGDVTLVGYDGVIFGLPLSATHTGPFNLAGDGPFGDVDPNGDNDTSDNYFDALAPDGMTYIGGTEYATDSDFVLPMFWGGYTGAGTYAITVYDNQWADFGSLSGVSYQVQPMTGDGSVTVKYNYDENIPEPATASLMLVGLGALVAIRRRRTV